MTARAAFVSASFDARTRPGSTAITVRFDPPRRRRGVYECRFEVRAGRKRVAAHEVYGEDGVQALLGAMMVAVVHIERWLARHRARIDSPVWDHLRNTIPPHLRRELNGG